MTNDYLPDTEIDPITGKIREVQHQSFVQTSINRKLLYTKDEVDAKIKSAIPSGSGTGIVQTIVAGGNVTVDSSDPANPIVAASSDKHYEKSFTGASTVIVDHNLGKKPAVTVIDSANDECEGEVVHNSDNQLIVSFTGSFSGMILCN